MLCANPTTFPIRNLLIFYQQAAIYSKNTLVFLKALLAQLHLVSMLTKRRNLVGELLMLKYICVTLM